jgi:hypothetical protein
MNNLFGCGGTHSSSSSRLLFIPRTQTFLHNFLKYDEYPSLDFKRVWVLGTSPMMTKGRVFARQR